MPPNIDHGKTRKETWSVDALGNRSETGFIRVLKRLVVLVLVSFVLLQLVATFAYVTGVPREDQGNIAVAKAQIRQFNIALIAYNKKFGALPASLDGLLHPPSGDPIMIAKEVPLDPWGNPYQYLLVGSEEFVILSLGADGAPGGEDVDADIKSDELGNEHEKSSGTLKKLNESLPTDRTQRCV